MVDLVGSSSDFHNATGCDFHSATRSDTRASSTRGEGWGAKSLVKWWSKMISWNLVDYFPYGVAPAVFLGRQDPQVFFLAIEPICASQEEEFWFWSNEVPQAVRMMAQSGQISRCQIGWSMKIYIYISHTEKAIWIVFKYIFKNILYVDAMIHSTHGGHIGHRVFGNFASGQRLVFMDHWWSSWLELIGKTPANIGGDKQENSTNAPIWCWNSLTVATTKAFFEMIASAPQAI